MKYDSLYGILDDIKVDENDLVVNKKTYVYQIKDPLELLGKHDIDIVIELRKFTTMVDAENISR